MEKKKQTKALPTIPDKQHFLIGEVSELCRLKSHVLRYWEQEFPDLKPVKRRGNRRTYAQKDIQFIRKIRDLLYFQGFTINGAKLKLKSENKKLKQIEKTSSVMDGVIEDLEKVLLALK